MIFFFIILLIRNVYLRMMIHIIYHLVSYSGNIHNEIRTLWPIELIPLCVTLTHTWIDFYRLYGFQIQTMFISHLLLFLMKWMNLLDSFFFMRKPLFFYDVIYFHYVHSLIHVLISNWYNLQYGPIVEIDLKIPPRPPGYAFVEVNIEVWKI